MAVNTKAIVGRINSVKSTKKITKAMEMISAVKMRRATENVLKSRAYAELGWEMLRDIAKKTDIGLHPLLRADMAESAPIGIILITGNRGLAGGFTSRLLNKINQDFSSLKDTNAGVEIILLGKKGRKIYSQYGFKLASEFEKIDLTTKIEEIGSLSQTIISEFTNKKYSRLYLAYMDFASAMIQTPRVRQLLPLARQADEELGQTKKTKVPADKQAAIEFKFEPNPKEVLDMLLPRLVETQIYQAILESDASEHSARMMSMKNASEAASDMIDELNHTFNRARQAAITQEISEIVGGAAMLD